MENNIHEYAFKITIVGNGSVGKTSLVQRFTKNSFDESFLKTLGANFSLYENKIGNNVTKLIIWDLAGQNDFNFLRPSFFKNNRASIIVFNLEDTSEGRESIDRITDWHKDVLQYSGDVPILLLGNKSDLIDPGKIDHTRFKQIVDQENFIGYEISSAKTGEGVAKSFNSIIRYLRKSVTKQNE